MESRGAAFMDDRKLSGSKSHRKIQKNRTLRKKRSKISPFLKNTDCYAPPLDDRSDLDALEDFCSSLQIEEISLNEWEKVDEKLDLIVPIWISAEEALLGCERIVSFVRTIQSEKGTAPLRQKVELLVQIPIGSDESTRIRLEGQGEIKGGKTGDLIVKIALKT
jgi:hypothetical protein